MRCQIRVSLAGGIQVSCPGISDQKKERDEQNLVKPNTGCVFRRGTCTRLNSFNPSLPTPKTPEINLSLAAGSTKLSWGQFILIETYVLPHRSPPSQTQVAPFFFLFLVRMPLIASVSRSFLPHYTCEADTLQLEPTQNDGSGVPLAGHRRWMDHFLL